MNNKSNKWISKSINKSINKKMNKWINNKWNNNWSVWIESCLANIYNECIVKSSVILPPQDSTEIIELLIEVIFLFSI